MTEQENKFLQALGITPGPWKRMFYDHGGSRIYLDGKPGKRELIFDTYGDMAHSALAFKVSEMFIALWHILYDPLSHQTSYINTESILLSAQTRCKTWEELCQLWEKCA